MFYLQLKIGRLNIYNFVVVIPAIEKKVLILEWATDNKNGLQMIEIDQVRHFIYCRAPSFPEIPEMSQMSLNCPEISNCPEILLIWSQCPDMDLCYAVVTALHSFCTLLS